MLAGLVKNFTKKTKPAKKNKPEPVVIPRADHGISRKDINPNALKVLYRLNEAGFSAYLVGGCVRDLMLGRHPKDFDIATSALPEEIRRVFRNCRLIGKRFRLAHILFGKDIIEVATFRTHHKEGAELHGSTRDGMIVRDNVYGEIEDDAYRRDFTINAMYYNVTDFSVLDYTHGTEDIKHRCLRMIGDPTQRFHEDPVRLIRALRFTGKLDLHIAPETEKPLRELGYLLRNVSTARLYQEILKFFHEGAIFKTVKLLRQYDLFQELFPITHESLATSDITEKLLQVALQNADSRTQEHKTVSPAFIFVIFLWRPMSALFESMQEAGDIPVHIAFDKAINTILRQQTETLAIPRNLQVVIHEIAFLQYRFKLRHGSAPLRLLDHPRFRAAYDLLLLRAEAGEEVKELSEWWTLFYNGSTPQRETMIKSLAEGNPKKKRRRNRSRRRTPGTVNPKGNPPNETT